MAGFTHIPPGDAKTLAAAIDEQTACVLISPSDLHDAAIPVSAEFLIQVRKLCDENQIPLILDESQLVFGASGYPATFQMRENLRRSGDFLGWPFSMVSRVG